MCDVADGHAGASEMKDLLYAPLLAHAAAVDKPEEDAGERAACNRDNGGMSLLPPSGIRVAAPCIALCSSD
jgi:hypothetical protein